jgi:hypothetical protein
LIFMLVFWVVGVGDVGCGWLWLVVAVKACTIGEILFIAKNGGK